MSKSSQSASAKPKNVKKITKTYLENAGVYYLQRFSASITQFRKVMRRKIDKSCAAYPDLDKENCFVLLEETIAKFIELGYLNDTAYSKNLITNLQQKGYSTSKIQSVLYQKGVPQSYDDTHFSSTYLEKKSAIIWARKKKLGCFALARDDSDDDTHQNNKALHSLARVGYSYDTAQWVLKLTQEEVEEFLNTVTEP